MYGSLQILTRTAPPWFLFESLLCQVKQKQASEFGDYSVTVNSQNSQLEDHRQPIPLPEDLMRKLGRGYCFSKIDLANAYNQICLSPDSQKKLALSTHKGVLLQKRLPFGIKSAPGYFQEIMEQLKNVFSPKYQLITWVTLYQVEELQKGPKLMPY